MSSSCFVIAPDGSSRSWNKGTPVGDAVAALFPGTKPIAALLGNDLVSLTDPLEFGGPVIPVFQKEELGKKVYEQTACFLLSMAVRSVNPKARLRIHNAAGTSLYCTLSLPAEETEATLARISESLAELVAEDAPITSLWAPYFAVLSNLEAFGYTDKANLLRHRNEPAVRIAKCKDHMDLWHAPLAPSTSFCCSLRLTPCSSSGFFLELSDDTPNTPAQETATHRIAVSRAQEHIRWGHILGIHTAGDLNESIAKDEAKGAIQMVEALHDQRLADIASTISKRSPAVRLVLIAGPSSAGKTTTSKRLATHLRVLGLRPIVLGTDDYFALPSQAPIDPATNTPDFEHIEAIDLPALNRDLNALLSGETIPLRTYDFLAQKPSYPGDTLTLPPDGILLIEGLHALNPQLTQQVPDSLKFRLFLNAMTSLGLDETTRVSTTDNRLLRRMIRDWRTRGKSPRDTLRFWSQVRRGEERWIFPFQPLADEVFNTALEYELAVLRTFAEPLLCTIKPDVSEYATARRLLRLLANFHALGSRRVPSDSILRETIGNSLFE